METKPQDAEGNILSEGDRVFGYDLTDNGYQRVYGTLVISDGRWCVDYDDGECFLVLDFEYIWKDISIK